VAPPDGVPLPRIVETLALIEALAEMQIPPLPPGKQQAILAKARQEMEGT